LLIRAPAGFTSVLSRFYPDFTRLALRFRGRQPMVGPKDAGRPVTAAAGKEVLMKTRMIRSATMACLLVLIPVLLNAQMAIKQPLFRVDIPFAFSAGGTHLPAGHYYVSHPGDPYLLLIEKDDGRARAMVYVHPSASNGNNLSTKLVFNKYGEQYFLSQVWTEPDREVHQCFKCRAEHILAAQVTQPQTRIVLAKQ
jgi:hypothetical protein